MSSLPSALFEPAQGFQPDGRFGQFAAEEEPPVHAPDPREQAYGDGYARGTADALARARAEHEAEDAARQPIESAFAALFEADRSRIEARLRECALALCDNLLEPVARDPEALTARIQAALELLRRSEDERVLRLHPDDIALIKRRLSRDIRIEPDPALERGGLRVESTDGGIEDGPGQWRRVLAEALSLETPAD